MSLPKQAKTLSKRQITLTTALLHRPATRAQPRNLPTVDQSWTTS